MALNLRNIHLAVGILGLALFVLQGQYMARVLVVPELPDMPRMFYRTAHLYLMLASALNIAAGAWLPAAVGRLQALCSALLLAAPPLLLWSFFYESTAGAEYRNIASYALYMVFGAAVLLALQALWRRRQ